MDDLPPLQHLSQPDALLIQAAYKGNLEGMKEAVRLGADVNVEREWCLPRACRTERLDIIQFILLHQGADITGKYNGWIQSLAIRHGDLPLLRLTAPRFDDFEHLEEYREQYAIMAIKTNQLEVLKYICTCTKTGEFVLRDIWDHVFRAAAHTGNMSIVKYLEKNGRGLGMITHDVYGALLHASVNMFLYLTRKYTTNRHFCLWISHKTPRFYYDTRIMMLVNLFYGRMCKNRWGDDPYYDSNVGMLVLTYVD